MQKIIAFSIVAVAALWVFRSLFRSALAAPIAGFLLKRGKVKWAMRIKGSEAKSGCDHCKH